jgi:hypothetical protein
MTAVLTTPGKATWSLAMAEKKVRMAKRKVEAASAAATTARKRLFDEMSTSVYPKVAAPKRTSTEAFATEDPKHALTVLDCIDVNDASKQEFSELEVTTYKYYVRTLSEKLVAAALYKSVKCSAMMAAKAVRFVFDVACEISDDDETHSLQWHSAQSMLKGRQTRGAGIVVQARKLLNDAIQNAKLRLKNRIQASDEYRRVMGIPIAAI